MLSIAHVRNIDIPWCLSLHLTDRCVFQLLELVISFLGKTFLNSKTARNSTTLRVTRWLSRDPELRLGNRLPRIATRRAGTTRRTCVFLLLPPPSPSRRVVWKWIQHGYFKRRCEVAKHTHSQVHERVAYMRGVRVCVHIYCAAGDSTQSRNKCWHFLQSGQGPLAEYTGITCDSFLNANSHADVNIVLRSRKMIVLFSHLSHSFPVRFFFLVEFEWEILNLDIYIYIKVLYCISA